MLNLHHIGYVVQDIDYFASNLVQSEIVERIYDETQKAELALILNEKIFIELIQPSNPSSFTYNFLQKGGGYHHLCYEVKDKNIVNHIIKTKRMIKTMGWVYAPLFKADVLFAYNKNKEIVEFLCQK
jgi:hypothetical protein